MTTAGRVLGTHARDRLCAMVHRCCGESEGLHARYLPATTNEVGRLLLVSRLFAVRVTDDHPGLIREAWVPGSGSLRKLSRVHAITAEYAIDAHCGTRHVLSRVVAKTTDAWVILDTHLHPPLWDVLVDVLGLDDATTVSATGDEVRFNYHGTISGVVSGLRERLVRAADSAQ